ncbi:MAG: glycosyl hydrolase [Armatimonadota bacterium]|nr:hypothetical protein [bacterium]
MLKLFKNPPSQYRPVVLTGGDGPIVSFERMKQEVDNLACTGSSTCMPQQRRVDSTIGPQSHRIFSDYAARLGYVFSQGRRRAQVAVLQPYGKYSSPHISKFADEYLQMLYTSLAREHISYQCIDEATLSEATALDQALMTPDENYELLIVPPVTSMGYEAALKIEEFIDDGGRVMCCTLLPVEDATGYKHEEVQSIFAQLYNYNPIQLLTDFDSGKRVNAGQVNFPENGAIFVDSLWPENISPILRKIISRAIKPEVSIKWQGAECGDIQYTHISVDGGELFFFANGSDAPREVQLSVRCEGAPCVMDLETGERTALLNCTQRGSRTILLHRFERYTSLLVAFTDEPVMTIPSPILDDGNAFPIPGAWQCTNRQYSHTAIYAGVAQIPDFLRGQRIFIKVAHPIGLTEFTVNGVLVGIRPWAPFEMDVSALVKPGPNEIKIKIISNSSEPCQESNCKACIYIC